MKKLRQICPTTSGGNARLNKGMTLVEVVAAFLIIAVVSVGVYSTLRTGFDASVRVQTQNQADKAKVGSLDLLKRMLKDTGDNQDEGVCSLFDTNMQTGGLGRITFSLPVSTVEPFEDLWTKHFPTTLWDPIACENSPLDAYVRCFHPKSAGQLGMEDSAIKGLPMLRYSVYPVNFKSNGAKLEPLSLPQNELNARDTAFMLSLRVTYEENRADSYPKTRTQFGLLWLGEFQCNKTIDANTTLVLNPSGIGSGYRSLASGTGEGEAYLFSTNKNDGGDILETSFKTTAYTGGRRIPAGNYHRAETLTSDAETRTNACTETNFRCKRRTQTQRMWNENVRTNFFVRYNQYNGVYPRSTIEVCPQGSFARGLSSAIEFEAAYDHQATSGFLPNRNCASGDDFNWATVTANTTMMQADIQQGAANACGNVCSDNNAYNTFGNPYRLKFDFVERTSGNVVATALDSDSTGCVCCYGKQCNAIGTGIRGWCHNQPEDPIDARFPECSAGDEATRGLASLRSDLEGRVLGTGLNPNQCLVGVVANGEFSIQSADCNQSYPVMCYSQGNYWLAHHIDNGEINKTYANASDACYQMSYERVNRAEVNGRIASEGGQNPLAGVASIQQGADYKYYNNALAGVFLAPHDELHYSSIVSRYSSAGQTKRFWIALKHDRKNRIVASEPRLYQQATPYISEFDQNGMLNYRVDNYSLSNLSPSTSSPATVLVHSRKYVGALQVSQNQGEELHVLCYNLNSNRYFRSSSTTDSFAEAPSLCRQEGALFYPPETPSDWANALLTVNPTSDDFPWPDSHDLSTPSGLRRSAVWLAVDSSSTLPAKRQVPALASVSSDSYTMSGLGHDLGDSETFVAQRVLCDPGSGNYTLVNTQAECLGTIGFPSEADDQMEVFTLLRGAGLHNSNSVIQIKRLPAAAPPDDEDDDDDDDDDSSDEDSGG